MSDIEDHHRRWGKLFSQEPWFEVQCALYEGPRHDWEGADLAMEQMLYALAKARGLDTTQMCPQCAQIVDQVRSLPEGRGGQCESCEAQYEWEGIADDLIAAEKRWAYRRWYESLTADQRALQDEYARGVAGVYHRGLIARDVQ